MSFAATTVCGVLGRDPERRTFQNGGGVVNMRVAHTESWKDRNTGEQRENTEWYAVTITGSDRMLDWICQMFRKGDWIFLNGRMKTRKWQDQSGADRYSTELQVHGAPGNIVGPFRKVKKDERGGGNQGGGYGDNQGRNQSGYDQGGSGYSQGGNNGGYGGDGSDGGPGYGGSQGLDDNIPF